MAEDEAELELRLLHCQLIGFQRWLFWCWRCVMLPFSILLSFLPSAFFHICLIVSDHFSLTGPICCFYFSAASWKYSVFEYTTLYLRCDELIAVSSSECDGASCLESLNRHFKALLPEEHQRTMWPYIHENYSLSSVLCSWDIRWQ